MRAGIPTVLGAALACLAGSVGAVGAAPPVTISVLSSVVLQPGLDVLIQNFERVNPSITVQATYEPTDAALDQVELSELAAGNAPDVLAVIPGCHSVLAVCELANDGYLTPMIGKPWVKRSIRLVTSLDKNGKALYAFDPVVTPQGMFTNDDLFRKLSLKIPQTFAQLLGLCARAKADGTAAILMDGASTTGVDFLLQNLAVEPVYANDPHWTAQLKAGKVSFDSSPGWRQALQEYVEMSRAGCFEPGFQGISLAEKEAEFASGQGLMEPGPSSLLGTIEAANPQFGVSFVPLPGGSSPGQTSTYLGFGTAYGVNAHSSPLSQAAAQAFIDFLARPEQNAVYATAVGSLSQYQVIKQQLPPFMSALEPVFSHAEYVLQPSTFWWNPNVPGALAQDGVGLVTGQESVDDVLNAMDAAWKQGPGN